MPVTPFSVHVDPDDLARRDLAAAVSLAAPSLSARSLSAPSLAAPSLAAPEQQPAIGDPAARHGLRDARQAARRRSDRDHAGRATGGSGRSYAFRRS